MEPRYPEGTPEYEEYRTKLRAELEKFKKGEPPYDLYPIQRKDVQPGDVVDTPERRAHVASVDHKNGTFTVGGLDDIPLSINDFNFSRRVGLAHCGDGE